MNDKKHTSATLGNPNIKDSQRMVSVVEPYELPEEVNIFELGNVLSYEQPTNYIVESTDYDDSYNTPVLTAGKSFIIGYTTETAGIYTNLPVIIFDDFTTSSQYVDFPFKVKSSAMKILSVNHNIADLKYIYFFMQVVQFEAKNHKRYWISEYSKIKINLPPLTEQQRIVNRIESMFAKLDEAKEKAQNVVDSFETRKAAILHQAFTGKLTAKWRAENGISDDSWVEKKLEDCTSIIGDGLHGTPKFNSEGQYFFINGGNLSSEDIIFTSDTKKVDETEYSKYKVFLNDSTVFLSINGSTLGKRTAFYKNEPIILGKSACYINVSEILNKYFLRYYFNSPFFQRYTKEKQTGSAIPNLGLKSIRNFTINLPTLPEQQEIVRILDSVLEKERIAKEAAEKVVEQIDLLKKSILARAFRGEL